MSQQEQALFNAEYCPYCGGGTNQVDSSIIYGRSYGPVWICENFPTCNSYVGTHWDGRALGRLANKRLRLAKKHTHEAFDALWKKANKIRGGNHRKAAYAWLAEEMGLESEYCHIGMFDEFQCSEVIQLCKSVQS